MDRNFLLFMATSMLILVVWQSFLAPPPPAVAPPEAPKPVESQEPAASPSGDLEGASEAPDTPRGFVDSSTEPGRSSGLESLAEERIAVSSERWNALFSSRGGGLLKFELRGLRRDATLPGEPAIDMVTASEQYDLALATPLRGLGYGDLTKLDYTASRPDPNTLIFERSLRDIAVRKTYVFEPDSYRMRLRIEIGNGTDHHLNPNFAMVWPARAREGADFVEFNLGAYTDEDLETFVIVPPAGFFMGGSASDETIRYSGLDWVGAPHPVLPRRDPSRHRGPGPGRVPARRRRPRGRAEGQVQPDRDPAVGPIGARVQALPGTQGGPPRSRKPANTSTKRS